MCTALRQDQGAFSLFTSLSEKKKKKKKVIFNLGFYTQSNSQV